MTGGTPEEGGGTARRLASRTLFQGAVLRLESDRVELPNGREAVREVARHPGAVAVVPMLESGEVVLVRQYRYPLDRWILEVPAGTLEPDETPEQCARRELEEEVGRRAGRLRPLGAIVSAPGFTDERLWLFLASALAEVGQRPDEDEVLVPVLLPFERAVELALNGEIEDAKSIVALLRARALVQQEKGV